MQHVKFASNPMMTRQDVAQALEALWLPLSARIAKEGACLDLGFPIAHYGTRVASLESLARPLWGLAPATAGGAAFVDWPAIARSIAQGTDESDPSFWGMPDDNDQRVIEYCALAVAVYFCERPLLHLLDAAARRRLAALFERVNDCMVHDNNWLLFRVIINSVLLKCFGRGNAALIENDLDRIDGFYAGNGWFSDGKGGKVDYYTATVFHVYSLLHVVVASRDDGRAVKIKDRAKEFAPQFAAWFSATGASLPFGRSLTYRFAPAAFWGALALANVEAMDWGCIRKLFLDNLRWWLGQDILTESGLLSSGYTYPNWWMGESYNSAGSSYWAFKAFLPLALPAEHPFWSAEEKSFEPPAVFPQPEAGLVVCHDKRRTHVWALSANSAPGGHVRHGRAKYTKFVYSTEFGFTVPLADDQPAKGGADNTLLLSLDGISWRSRNPSFATMEGPVIYSRWKPWKEVAVETWLIPAAGGHIRVHRLDSKHPLQMLEGGFSVNQGMRELKRRALDSVAAITTAAQFSAIHSLSGSRGGTVLQTDPLAHILYPLSATPALFGAQQPGIHWFVTFCLGYASDADDEPRADNTKDFGVTVTEPDAVVTLRGEVLLACRHLKEDSASPL